MTKIAIYTNYITKIAKKNRNYKISPQFRRWKCPICEISIPSANVQAAKAQLCFSCLYIRRWKAHFTDETILSAKFMVIFATLVFFGYFCNVISINGYFCYFLFIQSLMQRLENILNLIWYQSCKGLLLPIHSFLDLPSPTDDASLTPTRK